MMPCAVCSVRSPGQWVQDQMNTHQVQGTEEGSGETEEGVDGCGQQEKEEEEVCPRKEVPDSLDAYLDNPPDIKLWPEARQNCALCGKRSRLYCSDCLVFVGTPSGVKTPTKLRLPLEVKTHQVYSYRSVCFASMLLYYTPPWCRQPVLYPFTAVVATAAAKILLYSCDNSSTTAVVVVSIKS